MLQLTFEPCLTFTFCIKQTTMLWTSYSLLPLFKIETVFAPHVHGSTVYNMQDMEAGKCPSIDEWWNITQPWKKQSNATGSSAVGSEDGHVAPDSSCTCPFAEGSKSKTYYMWNLKDGTCLQSRNRLADIESRRRGYQKEKGRRDPSSPTTLWTLGISCPCHRAVLVSDSWF